MTDRIAGIVVLAATVGLVVPLVRQCRKPSGWLGRLFARDMNSRHRELARWGLSHAAVGAHDVVLDVGCGGGRTVQELARLAHQGTVVGLDYSAASVAVCRSLNAAAIAAGRVLALRGTVSALPFPAGAFDLVTAVETHYYWPDLERDLGEVGRVLKPGGRAVLIVESYRGRRFGFIDAAALRLIGGVTLSVDAHREIMAAAGFGDIQVFEERGRGWLCVTGTRPAAHAVPPRGQLAVRTDRA